MDYADRAGLSPAMARVFETVIRELDEAYLRWQREEQKRATQK